MLVQLGRDAEAKFAGQGGVAPAGIFGSSRGAGDAHWAAALRLYRRDQVTEAFQIASSSGAGDLAEFADSLQILDAEASTSEQSVITRINDWLEVETIPTQNPIDPALLGQAGENAIRLLFQRIGLRAGVNTLITLLSEDIVLPAHLDATGYVTLKRPYAKYCLPKSATTSEEHLFIHLQMLAATHAAAMLSGSMAPPWLLCATSALTDVPVSNEMRYLFCSGGVKWMEPSQLNLRLQGQDRPHNPAESAAQALAQAILVGRYLLNEDGVKTFRDCLSYHSPASVFHYFVLLFSNDPTRDACKKRYGFAPEYLFEQALASCCK